MIFNNYLQRILSKIIHFLKSLFNFSQKEKTSLGNTHKPKKNSTSIPYIRRKKAEALFASSLDDNTNLVHFFGINGIGKTVLFEKLQSIADSKEIPWVLVDFSYERDYYSKIELFEYLIYEFKEKYGFSFYYSDLLILIYWHKLKEDVIVDSRNSYFHFIREDNSLEELKKDLLEYFDWIDLKKEQKLLLKQILFSFSKKTLESIEDQIPLYFLADLARERGKSKKTIIFLDSLDALYDNNAFITLQWLKENLFLNFSHILFVTSSCEPIRVSSNKDFIVREYKLEPFLEEESRIFLQKSDLVEEELIDNIIAFSKGIPFYLSFAVDIYYEKKISFVGQKKDILKSFLEQLSLSEQKMIKVLAHLRFYTKELIETIIKEYKLDLNKEEFKNMVANKSYFVPPLIRRNFLFLQSKEEKREIDSFLAQYYTKEFERLLQANAVSNTLLKSFGELFYYKRKLLSLEELVKWLDEYFVLLSQKDKSKIVLAPLLYCLDKLLIYQEKRDLDLLQKVYGNIAHIYYWNENYHKALEYFYKELELNQKLYPKDTLSNRKIYISIADIYLKKGEYEKALEFYKKDIQLAIKKGIEDRDLYISYINIEVAYYNLKKFPEALESLQKASLIAHKLSLREDKTLLYENMADIYYKMKKFSEAQRYYKRALDELKAKDTPKDRSIANLYFDLARSYHEQKRYKEALKCYWQTITIYKKIEKESFLLVLAYYHIGVIYVQQEQYRKALSYLEKAASLQKSKKLYDYIYYHMAKSYYQLKKYSLAKEYFIKAQQILIKGKDPSSKALLKRVAYFLEKLEKIQTRKIF